MPSLSKLALAGVSLLFSLSASADVITYGDRTAFNAQGNIIVTSNFDDFSGLAQYPASPNPDVPSPPFTPYTRGDVTYTSSTNVVYGDCFTTIACSRHVMSNDNFTPITGDINTASQYTLFGFSLAVTQNPVQLTVFTNLGSYTFVDPTVPNGDPDFAFEGFQATGGEYFTGFQIDTFDFSLAGLTDVSLGLANGSGGQPGGEVPEPGTLALLGLPLAGLLAARRRRK